MGYKGYFTLSATAFFVLGLFIVLDIILFIKLDIKNIIKIFIRKLKVVIVLLVPLLFISKGVFAMDEESIFKEGKPNAEIRFKTGVFTNGDTHYYLDLGEEYFTFFVSVKSPENMDTVEVYVDDSLCFKSFPGDNLSKEIPIMLRRGYEPKEIVVVNRAKSGNTIRSIYKMDKDDEGPYINKNSIEVSDAKGIIGIDKRLKAFITGEDTVTVKIKDISDEKSGINSVYFKYYTKNAEHTIKGEYDNVTGEYYAILNLPKNSKREFFVITRDNLFNISATEDELINIITDNTSPELMIAKNGNYYEKGNEVIFKDKISFEITGKDQVGVKDISVYVNDTQIKNAPDIYSNEGGLLKEYSFVISEKDLFRGENNIKILAKNFGGHEESLEFNVYSDSREPVIKSTYINSSLVEIKEGVPDYFDNKDAIINLTIEDYDDAGFKREIQDECNLFLYDIKDDLLDQRNLFPDEKGKTSFAIRCDFKGYAVLKTKDVFSNELEFKSRIFVLEGEETFKKATKIEFRNYNKEFSAKEIDVPILVKSDFSGIKEVRYTLSSPNDTEENREGILVIKGKEENGYLTMGEGIIPVKNNSNDIKLLVEVISNCNNSFSEQITLNIDRTYPVISLEFADGKDQYYINHNRTLKIEIIERNFSRDNLSLTILKDGKEIGNDLEFVTENDPNPDRKKHIVLVELREEGEYSIYGAVRDMAGNTASLKERSFIIDKTPPKGEIIYDREIPENGFLNESISVKVKIKEDNLDLDSVKIKGDGISEDFSYTYEDGLYMADITFDKSGEYQISVFGNDMSGNALNALSSNKFILDLIKPNVLIYDLTNNKSYNNDLSFKGEVLDEHLDFESFELTLKNKSQGLILNPSSSNSSGKISFFVDKVERLPENDGIYELCISARDLAGNSSDKTVNFSINRFGSTFMPSKELSEISGGYTRVLGSVDIVEVNYDTIVPESTRVFLFRNGNTRLLNMEKDYEISHSNNGFLNSLTYSINKDNFNEDGIYAISIYSKDNAGNINITNRNESLISFVVDRTPPRVYSLNISSNEEYNRAVDMEIKAFDNMKLDSVLAYNNNNPVNLEKRDDKYILNLPLNNKKNNILLMATDSAGNTWETKIDNIMLGYENGTNASDILLKIIFLVILIVGIINIYRNLKRRSYGQKDN